MHRAVPKGGATVAWYHLPSGAIVGIACFLTFRSFQNFASPDEFLPERWLRTQQRDRLRLLSSGSCSDRMLTTSS